MKRSLVAVVCAGLPLVSLGFAHAAEKYPVKPITAVVAVEAGADGDVLVRPIYQRMSKILGQPILVVNKPGGGSSIGYRELHAAKPDGYTIGWGSATIITNKLQGVSPLDHHDFTQLGAYATYFPIVIGIDEEQAAIQHGAGRDRVREDESGQDQFLDCGRRPELVGCRHGVRRRDRNQREQHSAARHRRNDGCPGRRRTRGTRRRGARLGEEHDRSRPGEVPRNARGSTRAGALRQNSDRERAGFQRRAGNRPIS